MSHSRLDLHSILVGILGSSSVYFQPPTGIQIVYPCIIYKLNDVSVKFADNHLYSKEKEYSVTLIDKNPDTATVEKILDLPKCNFDRYFPSDNLNHYVFTLFF